MLEKFDLYVKMDKVVNKLKEMFDDFYIIESKEVTQNNSEKLVGVSIQSSPNDVAYTIYLDGIIDKEDVDSCAEYVANQYMSYRLQKEKQSKVNEIKSLVDDYTKASEYLTLYLINKDKNTELLENVPYKNFLDLAAIPVLKLSGDTHAKVNYALLKSWNMSFDDVYRKAYQNLCESDYSYFDTFMNEDMGILTSHDKAYGAGMIMNELIIKTLAEDKNDDIIMLPSSVHEVILVGASKISLDYANQMVKDVNKKEVSKQEFLSDHAYLYKRNSGWQFQCA